MIKAFIRTAVLVAAGFTALVSQAQTQSLKAAFMAMPESIAPLLTEYGKLDMIDYFESGMDTPTANVIDGKMRITELTDKHLAVELGEVMKLDVYLLAAGTDTLTMYISTLTKPIPDGYINVVNADTVDVSSRVFKAPQLSLWLTPAGKKERKYIESTLEYIGTAYTYDPESGVLTLSLEVPATISSEEYERLKPMLAPQLRYKWNGKKFEAQK